MHSLLIQVESAFLHFSKAADYTLRQSRNYQMSTNPIHKPDHQNSRSRELLTPNVIEQLIAAAEQQKTNGRRNAALIHLMYQFGLRTNEAIALTWDQIDLNHSTINIVRSKESTSSTHQLGDRELQLLHSLRKEQPHSHYVFSAKTEKPLTTLQVQMIVMEVGAKAGLLFRANSHRLRFAAAHRSQPVT